jgi:hypothetical protein
MSFLSLGLRPEFVRAAYDEDHAAPTPLQVQAISLLVDVSNQIGGKLINTGNKANQRRHCSGYRRGMVS